MVIQTKICLIVNYVFWIVCLLLLGLFHLSYQQGFILSPVTKTEFYYSTYCHQGRW